MKRKLISYELFENIQQSALSRAEEELVGAEPILANVLNVDEVNLVCYGNNDVLYETSDGSYIHAAYGLGKKHVSFKNIEQLILDEATEVDAAKKHVEEIMDAILDSNEAKANEIFTKYLNLPIMKRSFNEASDNLVKKKKKKKGNPFMDMIKGKKDKCDDKDKESKKSLKFKTKTDKKK